MATVNEIYELALREYAPLVTNQIFLSSVRNATQRKIRRTLDKLGQAGSGKNRARDVDPAVVTKVVDSLEGYFNKVFGEEQERADRERLIRQHELLVLANQEARERALADQLEWQRYVDENPRGAELDARIEEARHLPEEIADRFMLRVLFAKLVPEFDWSRFRADWETYGYLSALGSEFGPEVMTPEQTAQHAALGRRIEGVNLGVVGDYRMTKS